MQIIYREFIFGPFWHRVFPFRIIYRIDEKAVKVSILSLLSVLLLQGCLKNDPSNLYEYSIPEQAGTDGRQVQPLMQVWI